MSKLSEFLDYLENTAARHDPYVWGGQGQKLSKLLFMDLLEMERNPQNISRIAAYIQKCEAKGYDMKSCRIFDCSGLMTYKLLKLGVIDRDMTAKELYQSCKEKGPIEELKSFTPGTLLFQGESPVEIYHVGAITRDGTSTEAKGRDFGVIRTEFDLGRWDYYGVIF